MSAMAFIVSPVKPNVGFISTVLLSAMLFSLVCVCASGSRPCPLRLFLRLLLDDVIAKHESEFSHGSGLALVRPGLTEAVTRRHAAQVNICDVSANEEAPVLKGGRHGDRRARTAWT